MSSYSSLIKISDVHVGKGNQAAKERISQQRKPKSLRPYGFTQSKKKTKAGTGKALDVQIRLTLFFSSPVPFFQAIFFPSLSPTAKMHPRSNSGHDILLGAQSQ